MWCVIAKPTAKNDSPMWKKPGCGGWRTLGHNWAFSSLDEALQRATHSDDGDKKTGRDYWQYGVVWLDSHGPGVFL